MRRLLGNENKKGQPLPKQIDDMLQKFVEQSVKSYEPHIQKIILFGSYARGDFRSDSDIDLILYFQTITSGMGMMDSVLSSAAVIGVETAVVYAAVAGEVLFLCRFQKI